MINRMVECGKGLECENCQDHFRELKPKITEVILTGHFKKEVGDFDIKSILDCNHENFTSLHKFEEKVDGSYIFRAIHEGKHIVYAVDESFRLVFLRVFSNFKEYKKFIDDKKKIKKLVESVL